MHTTSVSLLERLRRREESAAWSRFVQLYTPLLFFWARRAGLQDSDAADLVQDVFTVLVNKLPEFRYDPHKTFRGWLRTITLNKWRDRQRQDAARLDQANEPDLSALAVAEANTLFEETEYRRQLLTQALEQLRPEFQVKSWQAFIEHGMNGRPAANVAADLGLTVGAVYAAKFRVTSRLREELQGLLD